MRILLYEPGQTGHRPVYLRYFEEAFREAGCSVVVVRESYAPSARGLAALAATQNASTIFVCTIGAPFKWFVTLAIGARLRGISVAGVYYLFNNLQEGWKSRLWTLYLRTGLCQTLFVPDFRLVQQRTKYPTDCVKYIPDPWDARSLVPVDRHAAAKSCGIDIPEACVFLLFGDISERKGLLSLLAALAQWDYGLRPFVRLLIAGPIKDAVGKQIQGMLDTVPSLRKILVLESRWIEESEHARFFSAATYLCALYPEDYKVSISTVIRSCAVQRPVVVGRHGVTGEIVSTVGCGLVCESSSVESIRATLERAYDGYACGQGREYTKMAKAGARYAAMNELSEFKSVIAKWVEDIR